MIVIAKNLVLSAPIGTNPNDPVIGFHNLVMPQNVTAENSAANFPASNLGNPITSVAYWLAANTDAQDIRVEIDSLADCDYVGIAGHNFGSAGVSVTILTEDEEETETELVQETILPDDRPAIFRFAPQSLGNIIVRLGAGDAPARAAVLYVGKLLTLQRRIYVGHTPLPFGREVSAINGMSQSGNFLGSIVLGSRVGTSFSIQHMTPDWYRENFDPFIAEASGSNEIQGASRARRPFFFAWRPGDYPREVGYCWLTNTPQPKNQLANGMMQIELQVAGISR